MVSKYCKFIYLLAYIQAYQERNSDDLSNDDKSDTLQSRVRIVFMAPVIRYKSTLLQMQKYA